ncbi:MAG: DUF1538 domain-containing protein [Eubacteriales bacterium]|nr:DUF1538 domain-containing protein [Eubacteriales bacterium]
MSLLAEKFKEVLYSVLPITAIVILLHFTLTPMATPIFVRFLIGAALVILGLTVFLAGVDTGITPIGQLMGSSMAKSNKILVVIAGGLLLGFVISIAEPDLHILADQVDTVTSGIIPKGIIVVAVSLGISVMMTIGLVRIIKNFPLNRLLTIIYIVIFILALFTTPEFLAIAFDASGATTGALTVPFMLGLATGVSMLKKDSRQSEEDSFGLVGITSSGAILAVMVMNLIMRPGEIAGSLGNGAAAGESIFTPFLREFPIVAFEIAIALLPILLLFLIFQRRTFKQSKSAVRKILFGMLFTFIGLVIFLVGVNAGFMEVGSVVGHDLALLDNKVFVIAVGFLLGMVTILAEPAVYVLTHQIEEVTSGYVKRMIVMVALCIGVALSVALSVVRILVPSLQLWHYLLPGYIISILMSFFVPNLFVGIAFDSGGVASGPMTATFILAYTQGVAEATEGANVMVDGFGVIAMVAMAPLIALQILGLIFKLKSRKSRRKVGIAANE